MRYNHESSTYHMAAQNSKARQPKFGVKYDSPGIVKGRQAPFTLAEIRGRD